MAKKTRTIYTEAQKSEVRSLLQEGLKHAEIEEKTGVAKSTINKIASDMKSGDKSNNSSPSTSTVELIKSELATIKKRKSEIEALLNGKLKEELESLSMKEALFEDVLKLYK